MLQSKLGEVDMAKIEILQGTNPMISIRLKGVELIPSFQETVDGDLVRRCSYFTVRHTNSPLKPV